VYDGNGDGGIEINTFCYFAVILGSIASSLFTQLAAGENVLLEGNLM